MSANNTIMVVGRAGRDAEVRALQSGRFVSKFSIAVTRPGKGPQGQDVTDWFQVDLWGRSAEVSGDLVKKGALLSVSGACHVEEWNDRDGNKRTSVKIAADGFQLLESRGSREETPADSDDGDDGDIPPF